MNKKTILHFYYVLIAVFFTLQLLTYINWPGDQTWFAERARELNYDYLGFAFQRYETWSSRLLIESATMFFSVHYLLFDIALFISSYLFIFCFNELVLKKEDIHLKFFTPILFVLLFSGEMFIGAGLIATVTNYYFPIVCLTVGMWLLNKQKTWGWILGIPIFIFAVMQEQIAFYSFLLFGSIVVVDYFWKKSIVLPHVFSLVVSLFGVASAKLSPGSAVRLAEEIVAWYPEFNDLSLWQKIYYGFVETNRVLFVDLDLLVIPLLFLAVLILSILKKRYLSSGLSLLMLILTLGQQLDIMTPFRTLKAMMANVREQPPFVEDLYIWFFLILLLAVIVVVIFDVFADQKIAISATIILIIGYGARMLVSLSPTIYASGVRTFMPLVFSTLIVLSFLLKEIYQIIAPKMDRVID